VASERARGRGGGGGGVEDCGGYAVAGGGGGGCGELPTPEELADFAMEVLGR